MKAAPDTAMKVAKLRLYPTPAEAAAIEATMAAYRSGCNHVSGVMFDNGFPLSPAKLQPMVYDALRGQCGLKAQMACNVVRAVVGRYKAVKEQLRRNPYRYRGGDGHWRSIQRTLEWLRKPIGFSRPQLMLSRDRDWSLVGGKFSMATLKGRVRVGCEPSTLALLQSAKKLGTATVMRLKGKFYACVAMDDPPTALFSEASFRHLVGIDRGLRFHAVTYDENGKTTFIDGRKAQAKRERFDAVRKELQSRGTKSAKRVLARISGRENRWMRNANHRASKALVQRYGPGTVFALEDLAGVSLDEKNLNRGKKGRHALRSWPFYQLEAFLAYKARRIGGAVVKVDPARTSQRCPVCGHTEPANRDHATHSFRCRACGYRSNDDRVAAMNIWELGSRLLKGEESPTFGPARPARDKTGAVSRPAMFGGSGEALKAARTPEGKAHWAVRTPKAMPMVGKGRSGAPFAPAYLQAPTSCPEGKAVGS